MTAPKPAAEDRRFEQLTRWLKTQCHDPAIHLTGVGGDASFRRYFRFQTQGNRYLAMDAPPDHEDLPRFLERARLFDSLETRVPRRFAFDIKQGFLILEDFGDLCLQGAITPGNAGQWYAIACQNLIDWQLKTLERPLPVPKYDHALLQRELDLFEHWFARTHLALDAKTPGFRSLCELLIESALESPEVLVHRDYHSRNLMVLDQGALGLIDFQDAVSGPVTYDLVSLLKDCYLDWPPASIEAWMMDYYHNASKHGLVTGASTEFRRRFDWMGLQRHLKVAGIFARLYWRDGKSSYLNDLPRVLGYIGGVTARYPEFAEFDRTFRGVILPAVHRLGKRP